MSRVNSGESSRDLASLYLITFWCLGPCGKAGHEQHAHKQCESRCERIEGHRHMLFALQYSCCALDDVGSLA